MCVIYVREDAEELAVDMLDCRRERLVEFLVCLGGEDVLIVYQILNGGHDIVDICRRGEGYLSSILVDPSIIESRATRHRGARLLCAAFRQNTIELVQVRVEIIDVNSHPFHYVHVFR